jgi:hypothetical protein
MEMDDAAPMANKKHVILLHGAETVSPDDQILKHVNHSPDRTYRIEWRPQDGYIVAETIVLGETVTIWNVCVRRQTIELAASDDVDVVQTLTTTAAAAPSEDILMQGRRREDDIVG